MRPTVLLLSFSLPLFAIGCSVPKYRPTEASYRQAIVRGELKEALASFEAQAQEAEKNASTSWFPQQYWIAATEVYGLASSAALYSGQLEKSIAYGEKAQESAEKIKGFVWVPGCMGNCVDQFPAIKIRALTSMANAYKSIRMFAKARRLIEKGLEAVTEVPSNLSTRASSESNLYRELGEELMRSGEHTKAIEALLVSVYLRDDYLARLRSNFTRDLATRESARINFVNILALLGNAYRQARQPEEALEQYQRAFSNINEWGIRYPYEDRLYVGMGELYREQKNFPQALDNFNQALAIAENYHRPDAIISASTRIGDVLREIGKADEAMPLYQGAIRQIESTRSLLQSEEYRQSYFEGAVTPIEA